jgi:imidazolonepropionase-like amidohydrolase
MTKRLASSSRRAGCGTVFLAIAVLLLHAAPAAAQSAQDLSPAVKAYVTVDAPLFALTHVRVIDGTGAPAREDQTIVVRDGRILAVGDAAATPVPEGAQVLEMRDRTVMPGIVGMHDHLIYPAGPGHYNTLLVTGPRLYLACGVTTIRTTGGMEVAAELNLKKAILKGRTPGPKMNVTSPFLEGRGAFTVQMSELGTPEEARAMVRFWDGQGADDFKVYMNIPADILEAVVDEAHKLGKKVTGHLGVLGFSEAADIGIDDLEHGLYVDTEFVPGKKPGTLVGGTAARDSILALDASGPELQALIRKLVSKGTAVTSTLPVFEASVPGRQIIQRRVLDAMATEPRIAFLAGRARIGEIGVPSSAAMLKKEMEFERAFVKAGGLLLAGPDPTGYGGVLPGYGDQREIELLVEADFTPVEAIKIATHNGALYLGRLDRIGTLAPGKQADMVVVRGNPAANIADIENVVAVFKDGVGYDPAKLVESVRSGVGLY